MTNVSEKILLPASKCGWIVGRILGLLFFSRFTLLHVLQLSIYELNYFQPHSGRI
jgi:hypothetical protein